MFRVRGRWVSPAEVEGVLIEHAAVLESAVVGQMYEQGLEKPKGFLVLNSGVIGVPNGIMLDDMGCQDEAAIVKKMQPDGV
jgi:4-hydroxybenzoate-CoA ligase